MKLALLGGGGHCCSCLEVARSAGIEIAGIITPEPVGIVLDVPRLGGDEWLDRPEARALRYLVAVGQTTHSPLRRRLFALLQSRGLECAKIVASTAEVSEAATIGSGSILMHRVVANAGAEIGANCIINTGAIIEHGAKIGDHCHISTGAIVNGDAEISERVVVGSGAVVLQCTKIVADVVIGAGAVVLRDIDESGTWVGVPARRLN